MRQLLFAILLLTSCRYLSQHIGAEPCNNSDGVFLSCSGDLSAKLICQSGFQVAVACGGVCLDDVTGQGCPADVFCGDGLLAADEACDDGAQNSDTNPDACRLDCQLASCLDGVTDSAEACDDGNQNNTDECTNQCLDAACGDGLVSVGEACDGADLNGQSCALLGAGFSGAVSCHPDCTLDTSGCADCGDGVVSGAEGCDDTATTIGCNNLCAFDLGTCALPISLTPAQGSPFSVALSSTAVTNSSVLTGGGVCLDNNNNPLPAQNGREQVFSFNPPPNATFAFTLNLIANDAARDMSLYLITGACSGGIVSECSDAPGGLETLSASVISGATPIAIFFVVDSKDSSGEGPFTLTITPN